MTPRIGAFLVLLGLAALSLPARADEASDDQVFAKGVEALQQGSYERAIASFEALADRGYANPDAAYNRGLSYLLRVRNRAEQPGDLGRAAAAFEECLLRRSDDADAEAALDLVRAEVARRKAHRGSTVQMQARPTLDRAIVGLAPENAWAVFAMLSSLLLAVGLACRKAARGPVHLVGVIGTPIGAACLALFATTTWAARHLRQTTDPAVVVVSEARLVDDKAAALNVDPIPEAARVEVSDRKGGLVRVRYGAQQGWTHATSVRVLMR